MTGPPVEVVVTPAGPPVELLDESGVVVERREQDNLIVTTGKQHALDRLFGLSGSIALAGMAVGTSSTAAAVGDTAITGAVYKVFDATPTRTALTVTAFTTYTTAEANIAIRVRSGC